MFGENKLTLIVLLAISLLFISCNKSDDSVTSTRNSSSIFSEAQELSQSPYLVELETKEFQE